MEKHHRGEQHAIRSLGSSPPSSGRRAAEFPLKVTGSSCWRLRVPSIQQRLPVLREFSATGGDWAAFQRHFLINCETAGWTEDEVLRVLSAALNNDALAALVTILPADHTTLHQATQQMVATYGLPFNTHHRFAAWSRGDTETPLTFHNALLDEEGIDALVTEKLLSLPWELRVIIHAFDDTDLCSLQVVWSIQAHVLLQRETGLVVCAAPEKACSQLLPMPSRQPRMVDGGGTTGHVETALGEDVAVTGALHWDSGCRDDRVVAPTAMGEVWSFIDFVSYFRRFVAGFDTIPKPLHMLTAKGQKFHWGEEEASFLALFEALTLDSEDEDFVPPTALEDAEETLLAEQGAIRARDASPSVEATLWEAHGHLAELLHATASLLAEISPTVSLVKEGAAMLIIDIDSAAISQLAGNSAAPFCRRRGFRPDGIYIRASGNTHHKFATRWKGETVSALAFHSELLALAKAAF
ncbi:unnamed protein product [Lampetra planeri]